MQDLNKLDKWLTILLSRPDIYPEISRDDR